MAINIWARVTNRQLWPLPGDGGGVASRQRQMPHRRLSLSHAPCFQGKSGLPIRGICKQHQWGCWQTELHLAPPELRKHFHWRIGTREEEMSPSDGSEEEKQHEQAEENLENGTSGRILVTGWSVNPPNTQEPVSHISHSLVSLDTGIFYVLDPYRSRQTLN